METKKIQIGRWYRLHSRAGGQLLLAVAPWRAEFGKQAGKQVGVYMWTSRGEDTAEPFPVPSRDIKCEYTP